MGYWYTDIYLVFLGGYLKYRNKSYAPVEKTQHKSFLIVIDVQIFTNVYFTTFILGHLSRNKSWRRPCDHVKDLNVYSLALKILLSKRARIGCFVRANIAEAILFRNPSHYILLMYPPVYLSDKVRCFWYPWRHTSFRSVLKLG